MVARRPDPEVGHIQTQGRRMPAISPPNHRCRPAISFGRVLNIINFQAERSERAVSRFSFSDPRLLAGGEGEGATEHAEIQVDFMAAANFGSLGALFAPHLIAGCATGAPREEH